jgi:hypothetical protein
MFLHSITESIVLFLSQRLYGTYITLVQFNTILVHIFANTVSMFYEEIQHIKILVNKIQQIGNWVSHAVKYKLATEGEALSVEAHWL